MNQKDPALADLPEIFQNPDDIHPNDLGDAIRTVERVIEATRNTRELDMVRTARALASLERLKTNLSNRLLEYYQVHSRGRAFIGADQYEAENGPLDVDVILAAAEHPNNDEGAAAFSITGALGQTSKYISILKEVYGCVVDIVNAVAPVTGIKPLSVQSNAAFQRKLPLNLKPGSKPDVFYTLLFTPEALSLILHESRVQRQRDKGIPVEKETVNDVPVVKYLQKKEDKNADEYASKKSGYVLCNTQTQESIGSLIVGGIENGEIHLWENNTVLSWRLVDETFETQEQFTHVETAMQTATGAWNQVKPGGVSFTRAQSAETATFTVAFTKKDGNVFATSFFPAEYVKNNSKVTIYPVAFKETGVKDLANIMCHELGHVLGFRHEFALETERVLLGGRFGGKDSNSVMSYNHPPSLTIRDVTTSRSVYQHFQGGGIFELPDDRGRNNKFTVSRVNPTTG